MLFATDKFTLSFGDTAKLTIQYENTTLTNTGKKQAIVEASKDGYTWAQVASIAPESSLPLKIEALYVRLTTDTTISVVNTNPIPRDAKKSDIAVNINTEALVIKDDLQAYVSKNELNDLVHHPDLSGFVTKSQVQQMIPEIPTPPDITGLASKESVELKADQTDVDGLKLTVATKADESTVVRLQNDLENQIIPSLVHLYENKADKAELSALAEQVTQSEAAVDALTTQVTGFQSELDDRVTKSQAEDANRVLLNAIAARATTEHLNALHDEVKQKANQQQVDELVNKAFHLEQDKANKAELIELTKTITLLESIISGNADPALLEDIKTDILAEINPELSALLDQALSEHSTVMFLREYIAELQLIAATQDQVSDLNTQLESKADAQHTHTMSDVTGLAEALAGKSDAAHKHSWGSISGKPTTFNPSTHTHSIANVTGLQDVLDDLLLEVGELKKLEPTGESGGNHPQFVWTYLSKYTEDQQAVIKGYHHVSVSQRLTPSWYDRETSTFIDGTYLNEWSPSTLPLSNLYVDITGQNRTVDPSKFHMQYEESYSSYDLENLGEISRLINLHEGVVTLSITPKEVYDFSSSLHLNVQVMHPDILAGAPLELQITLYTYTGDV